MIPARHTPLACPHCGEALVFEAPTTSRDGRTSLDAAGTLTAPSGRQVKLSPQQANVLQLLLAGFGRPVRKATVYDMCHGARPDSDWPDERSLDAVVCQMRARLEGSGLRIRSAARGLWVLEEGERTGRQVRYSPADDETIRCLWGRRPLAEIAVAVGRTGDNSDRAVFLRGRRLGLPPLGRGRRRA